MKCYKTVFPIREDCKDQGLKYVCFPGHMGPYSCVLHNSCNLYIFIIHIVTVFSIIITIIIIIIIVFIMDQRYHTN